MNGFDNKLRTFARRVRLVRAWRGLALGGLVGGGLALVLALMDFFGLRYTDWTFMGGVVLASAIVGSLVSLFMPLPQKALADSIDRRGDLKNRLLTAIEQPSETGFSDVQTADARAHVQELSPVALYPIRLGRMHAGLLALMAAAAAIFLLGNSSALLDEQGRRDKDELKAAAKAIERIAKPIKEDKPFGEKPDEKELARKLDEFRRELEKARMSKKDALQDANELAKKADELQRKRFEEAEKSLQNAETALKKLAMKEMAEKGTPIEKLDPSMFSEQNDSMQAEQQRSLEQQIQKMQEQLQKGNLSQAEKDALESKIAAAQDALQQLKLSKEAQEVFKKLMESKEMQEIRKMMEKLQQACDASQQGEQQKLTQEEVEEMQRQLEELAKQLKDPEAMKEFLEELKKSLEEAKGG